MVEFDHDVPPRALFIHPAGGPTSASRAAMIAILRVVERLQGERRDEHGTDANGPKWLLQTATQHLDVEETKRRGVTSRISSISNAAQRRHACGRKCCPELAPLQLHRLCSTAQS